MSHKFLILCSGVGFIQRGFESFAIELSEALKNDPIFPATLCYGGPSYKGSGVRLRTLSRESKLAQLLGTLIRRSPYFVEQAIFTIKAIPLLIQSGVVLTSDGTISNLLWYIRKITGLNYRIIFSNGAPFNPPYPKADLVHHVNPESYETAIQSGLPQTRHCYIPYGFEIPNEPPADALKNERRLALGVKSDELCILCVGAIGKNHKRIDHLIRELEGVPKVRLLVAGQSEPGFKEIENEAKNSLAQSCSFFYSLSRSEVNDLFIASDLLVLPSLHEGFGRVVIEAASNARESVVHESPMNKALFSKISHMLNMENPGELKDFISKFKLNPESAKEAFFEAKNRYSWRKLTPQYIDCISELIKMPTIKTTKELKVCLGSHK